MPKVDKHPVGSPCWVDLMTSDPDKSRAFYTELFGWTAGEGSPEFGGYFMFFKDGIQIAGGMGITPEMQDAFDVWSVYLATDDAQATAAAAVAQGSQTIVAPMDIADLGRMAVVTDPGQAVIGMWQPGEHKGFGLIKEPGSVSWCELHTRDYDKVVPFYKSVFKWDAHTVGDSPEFRYTTRGEGDDGTAGIMDASGFLPEGVPAHWSVYFHVDDADVALKHVEELGGRIVQPAETTPYGRLATAADSTGALFKLRAV